MGFGLSRLRHLRYRELDLRHEVLLRDLVGVVEVQLAVGERERQVILGSYITLPRTELSQMNVIRTS